MKTSSIDPYYAWEFTLLFGVSLMLWILGLVIISTILFYELLIRYIDQRQKIYRFKDVFAQILSHRLGNFLLTLKVNTEILKREANPKALDRIVRSLAAMEDDFGRMVKNIDTFDPSYFKREEFMLEDLVKDVLRDFADVATSKRLVLRLQKAMVYANKIEARLFVTLLVENAFKFGLQKVYIRTGTFRKRPYLLVINDIKVELLKKGVGIGLMIAQNIAAPLRIQTQLAKGDNKHYYSLTWWPKKRWYE